MSDNTPAIAAPSGGAWTYRFAGEHALAPVLTEDGRVLFTATTKTDASRPATLFCVDLATTRALWQYRAPGRFTTLPAVDDRAVYVGNGNGLWAIDLATESDLWYPYAANGAIACQPVVAGNILLFGTTNGVYYGLDKTSGVEVWSSTNAILTKDVRPSRAAVVDEYAVFSLSKGARSTIVCTKLDTGQTFFANDMGRGITTDPVVVANVVYFGCTDGQLLGFSVPDGAIVLDATIARGSLEGPLATDGAFVYAGGADGNFYARALDPSNELLEWQLPVSHSVMHGVIAFEGEAFFTGVNNSGSPYFYTLDLESADDQTASVLVESLGGTIDAPATLSDGRIGIASSGGGTATIYVVDPSESAMLSRVKFSSRLIVGDYDVDGTGQPRNPEFQLLISITDANQIAQTGVKVAIWASKDKTTLKKSDATSITLGASSSSAYTATTDSSGEIRFSMDGDLGTASLYLRPEFFASGYSLQVFPDQETVSRLATVQATAPAGGDPRLGLTNATSYTGQPVLNANYRSDAENVAATIRNTVGVQQNVSTTRLTKPSAATSEPVSGPEAAAARGIEPGEVPQFVIEFDYAKTSLSFTPSSAAEVDAMLAATPQATGGAGGLGDFVGEVTHGAKKVKKLSWKHVEEGGKRYVHVVSDVVDEAGKVVQKAYDFAVQTVEEAVQVLKGVIKDIVTAIESFIEWLSWLFDWDDILETKETIRNTTIGLMHQIGAWAGSPQTRSDVKATLESLRADIDSTFAAGIQALTGKTLGSAQQSVPSKHDAVHPQGVDITTQLDWLIRKLPHPANVTFDISRSQAEELLTPASALVTTVQELLKTAQFQQLPADLEKVAADFVKLFGGSASGLLKQEMADIAAVVEDVIDLLFDFVIALVDAVFDAIAASVEAVTAMLDVPVDLGFLTKLYRLIGGGELRLLDAAALILAVPVTVTTKVVETAASDAKTAQVTGFDPRWSLLDLTAAFGYLVYGAVAIEEVYAEAAKDFSAVAVSNMVQGCLNAAVTAASTFEMLEEPAQGDFTASVAFTVAQMFPTFANCYVYCAWKWSPTLWDAWQEGLGDSVWVLLGALNLMFCPAYAIWYPDDYLGKNGVTLINNVGTSLPYFTPIMPSPNWSAVLTGAGYAIGIGTSFAAAFEE